ncbi:MAG TPA: isoprenylcysteine carboxylmethyltransferase family protein [Candidatus Binatia bacterium]|nr:isoprenylcysteine carboxylmethyltransferase family protein [Candidatus Binatia bacterium]
MSVTDALLLAAWLTIAVDNLRLAGRSAAERIVHRAWTPPRLLRLSLLALILVGARYLERSTGGPWATPLLLSVTGLALAAAGVALHLHARRVLGRWWSAPITVRADQVVVTDGPYARVRHPLYLAILLLTAGTVLAHPSVATLCLATGLTLGVVLKIPMEERALRTTLGERYARYAARVPALVPRVGRG